MRSFIMGMRLWPPLKILASSPYCLRKATASGMVLGRRYSKAGEIIASPYLPQTQASRAEMWESPDSVRLVPYHTRRMSEQPGQRTMTVVGLVEPPGRAAYHIE